ncbi:xanthine dehydrogenase molybdopterin binding subunit [Stagnihabitans tardus]|uniref:Xanthine dehydrogenase molybdopterin binding subunit n=1 Tax=Stagnihabitans tardus TaxID=2699202 RepID=A0AAE5BWU1_9RHOB|nr:xanthine dehydrogenase molybdopterin binding subunit [Stagnihabitans tardus]NBZ88623.1 xanthine dehydrogenase molybdopterin binding subunit [Stagnihabitans tardus]
MRKQAGALGAALPHDSAPLHVTGRAPYVDDLKLPGDALHLAFGLSTVAHAEIEALDLSAVRAAPGVVLVLTAQDFDHVPDVSPVAGDEPLLADGTVHYLGQAVFLVAATSHLAARKAARLAKVTYRERPAILTVEEALAAGSRFETGPITWARGDLSTGFAAAKTVVEGEMEVGGQEHFYLEGQVAAAIPTEDGVQVMASTQHPTEIQHKVAHALHLPMAAVRVEMRRMGGGFGGKESQGNALAVACAVVASRTGRPAKMRYDRDDDMMITGKRHDLKIRYRAGCDAQGRITAMEVVHLMRCGWSQDLSLAVADRAMLHADNAYFIPNIRIESHRLKTNTQSATAYRGFGGPQGIVGMERIIDHLAHATGRDPVAIMQANFYAERPGGSPAKASPGVSPPGPQDISAKLKGEVQTTQYGMEVEDSVSGRLVGKLLADCDYHARKAAIAEWNAGSPVLKRGIAVTPVKFGISFTLTFLNQAGALVHVYQDGSVHLSHGGTEMGQGLNQKVAQVVAEVFGLSARDIQITAADTGKVPNTSATAASSGSDLNGKAAEAAALTIRARMAEFLAGKYGVAADTVRFKGGEVLVAGESHAFARVAEWVWQARISLSSTGFYATPKITWDRVRGQGRPFLYFAYGAAVTEVVIDTLTGENRILRTDILHDCGRSLNPALDIGQVEGAYVQGAGWLTTEELVWDAKGRLATHAPSTYKIPAVSDRPAIFNVALWTEPNQEDTVGKSKAVGEPPFNLGISALMALSHALSFCGTAYPALDAPATAERVLMAVERVRHG